MFITRCMFRYLQKVFVQNSVNIRLSFLVKIGMSIVSQPSKCLKFMTFREGCFVIHVEYKYLSETFYHHQFYKR